MGGPAVRLKPVSRKPMAVKNAIIRENLLKKTTRRPAERFDLAKQISELNRYGGSLPESKKPVADALLRRLKSRHETIRSNVEKMNANLRRYKFNEENVKFLEILRKQELRKTSNNEYAMSKFAEQKIRSKKFTIQELLKAGYTEAEVAGALYSLEINK